PGLQPLRERDAEGERLARAGRGLDENVPTVEHVLEDEALDGERGRDPTAGQGAAHGAGDAEIGEGLLGHLLLLLTALAGACGSEALADPNRSRRDSSELTPRPKVSTAASDGNRRHPRRLLELAHYPREGRRLR